MKNAKYSFFLCVIAGIVIGGVAMRALFETFVIPAKDATIQNLQTKHENAADAVRFPPPAPAKPLTNDAGEFDTTIAKYYDEKFNKRPMIKWRVLAATALKECYQKGNWDLATNSTDGLDQVLGFFDDLGYDEQHGRISADVIHQYFYDDIAAYYQGSVEYISDAQKEDATYFENIKPLFNDVTKIEMQKAGVVMCLTDKDYLEYLRSEIDLKNDK